MNRIRFRSPLRAVIYEMRGLFLWWGVLAAFTSACLLWYVHREWPEVFLPAVLVALAAWAAPAVAVWSLLSPPRPASLPDDADDPDGWRKALRALARFLIYQQTRGGCDRETKELLRDGEKRVRAALKGVRGARQLQAAWADVRERVVRVWAERTWRSVRPAILGICREAPPAGADPYEHRSSGNWRAAREVFRRTMPQLLAADRSRWEIRCEILALSCAVDGRFPGVPTPVLSGLFALCLSDLSLPWDPADAIELVRPRAEEEARLAAAEGFAPPPRPAAPSPLAGGTAAERREAPVAEPAERPETVEERNATPQGVPPRPAGKVHFPTHPHGEGRSVPHAHRHHRHRRVHRRSFRERLSRDIARVGEAFLTFGQRLRYTFRIWYLGR